MCMQKEEGFSSSEEFAKSLEPNFEDQELDTKMKKLEDKYLLKSSTKKVETKEEETQPNKIKKTHTQTHKRTFKDPHAHHKRKKFELFAVFYILLILVLIAFLSVSADTNPFVVLVSLLPTLLTIIIALIIYESHRDNKNMLWAIPLILIYGFYWLGTEQSASIFKGLNIDMLTALNIFFSFIYLIINYFILQQDYPIKQVINKTIEQNIDLSSYIASIEDKSKALNFVIGRVYNAYHGGTKELRLKINMKQEWYDQFSQIPANPSLIDFKALKILITTIEHRLESLEKTEAEVFQSAHRNFKNLIRNPDGLDRVIDVLDKNDKDPVKSYFEGALEFCGKIKTFITHRKAPEVENDYIERPDPKKKNKVNTFKDILKNK